MPILKITIYADLEYSIILEVRAIREHHAASLEFDLDRIFADLQERQAKHAAEGWTVIPAPVRG